jgi:hypothetical protein
VALCAHQRQKEVPVADTVDGALDLPLVAVVREEPRLDADVLHGLPGSREKIPLLSSRIWLWGWRHIGGESIQSLVHRLSPRDRSVRPPHGLTLPEQPSVAR